MRWRRRPRRAGGAPAPSSPHHSHSGSARHLRILKAARRREAGLEGRDAGPRPVVLERADGSEWGARSEADERPAGLSARVRGLVTLAALCSKGRLHFAETVELLEQRLALELAEGFRHL